MRNWFLFLGVFLFLDAILLSAFFLLQGTNTKTSVIFLKNNIVSTPTPAVKETKLMLVGDIMLGRTVNIKSLEKNDPTYPFLKIAEKLKSEDIVFANLESPIVENCPSIESGFTFCADPKMVSGMVYSGVDVVTIANNHTHNFGEKGLEDTKKILTKNSIKWVGDGNLEILEKNGAKFGFLGFDLFDNDLSQSYLDLIQESKTNVDVLVVGIHWGQEYTSIATKKQELQAQKIIDAGADVISGHHPHWVQNSQNINGKPVYFSLGNFIFDQMWSEKTKQGLAVELTFDKTNLMSQEKHPVYMSEWAQPEWVSENN